MTRIGKIGRLSPMSCMEAHTQEQSVQGWSDEGEKCRAPRRGRRSIQPRGNSGTTMGIREKRRNIRRNRIGFVPPFHAFSRLFTANGKKFRVAGGPGG